MADEKLNFNSENITQLRFHIAYSDFKKYLLSLAQEVPLDCDPDLPGYDKEKWLDIAIKRTAIKRTVKRIIEKIESNKTDLD